MKLSSAEDVKNELSKGLTKRDLISRVHSLFDPIQAFLPISSQMKIIYRDLLSATPQMKWDDKIPDIFKSRIEAILMQTLSIQDVEMNRYLLKGFPQEDRRRLIIFSDG